MKHMTSDAILDEMEKLFPDAHCELNHRSPFELLVAVVLSAQTTDASVNRVTPQLFEKFPTPQAMAQASVGPFSSLSPIRMLISHSYLRSRYS